MQVHELALQRNKYKHLSDEEWRWFLQQVEGRERTADKLPTFAVIDDWWYPVRLSCEQCSSELTAKYKASLVGGDKLVDLTAGYGVDTYFLSQQFKHTDYVEQNAELCRIAKHNFADQSISIHNTTAEVFLQTAGLYDLIFADPARRDTHGGKVFRLEDCTPNVVILLPELVQHLTPKGRLMLKLSPMLDITQAINALSLVTWDVHVIAIKNEVKEVLLLSGGNGSITAVDLDKKDQAFIFTKEEERLTAERSFSETVLQQNGPTGIADFYLYEPNASILKAGAYKLVAQRFGLKKLDINTHLYASDTLVDNFPGRVWQIINAPSPMTNANIVCRNYPLTPEQLKKKLKLKDGGDTFIIGCRVNGKPTVFTAKRFNECLL